MKTARSGLVLVAVTGLAAAAAGVAAAAKPVSGTIAGPVTAVQGKTFTLKSSLSPTGKSKVHVVSKTVITMQTSGTRDDLKKGVCVFALGQKNTQGVVEATRLMLSAPVKGTCQTGFRGGRSGGTPPQGAQPPRQGAPRPRQGSGPGDNGANFGFASGAITAVAGSVLTVRGPQGSTKVAISAKTELVKTARVGTSAIRVGLCTFVRGTSTDKGVNVTAESVDVFKPTAQGCTGRVRRR